MIQAAGVVADMSSVADYPHKASDFQPGQRVQMPAGHGTVTRVEGDRVYVRPDTATSDSDGIDMDADELRYVGKALPG